MASARKRPGDYTGILAEEGNLAYQEELKERAQEISLLAQVEQVNIDTPIDYSEGPKKKEAVQVSDEVELHPATLTVRLVEDLDNVTFGANNHYENLKKGQLVTLPYDFAKHLMSKNLVWDGRYRD